MIKKMRNLEHFRLIEMSYHPGVCKPQTRPCPPVPEDEPDRVLLRHEDTDYICLINRHPLTGHQNGYVGVEKGHPCYGKKWDELSLECHGGVTYADRLTIKSYEDHWFIGFDCNHSGDVSPGSPKVFHEPQYPETYRDIEYVLNEIHRLALQLKEVNHKPVN